jgi:hypothetical protein
MSGEIRLLPFEAEDVHRMVLEYMGDQPKRISYADIQDIIEENTSGEADQTVDSDKGASQIVDLVNEEPDRAPANLPRVQDLVNAIAAVYEKARLRKDTPADALR